MLNDWVCLNLQMYLRWLSVCSPASCLVDGNL